MAGTLVAHAGTNITAPETMTFLGKTTKSRVVDVGKQGFGPGDVIVFVENLTDDGTSIGKARVQCTFNIGDWAICVAIYDITGRGQIVGENAVHVMEDPSTFDVPITGGSGDFSNVRGVDHIEPLSDTEEQHTLELIP